MPKYSTGDSGNSEDNSCQLCGATDTPLETAEMAGATVSVCNDCSPGSSDREDKTPEETHTGSKLPNQGGDTDSDADDSTPGYTISNRTDDGNADWIKNANYGNANTPYMQKNYDAKFAHALKEHDVDLETLSEETGIPIADLEALEDGEALAQEVSKDAIEVIEQALDIELKEDL